MSQDLLFDPGAPLERTQMAWTRTALAALATSAIGVRLLLSRPREVGLPRQDRGPPAAAGTRWIAPSIAARVCGPTIPSTATLVNRCTSRVADAVCEPKIPSTSTDGTPGANDDSRLTSSCHARTASPRLPTRR